MRKCILTGFWCLFLLNIHSQEKFTISGYITEKGSKESLPGVYIVVPKLKTGTTTNAYGFFSLTLSKDSVELIISSVGYQPQKLTFFLNKDIKLNTELSSVQLDEVVVSAEQSVKVSDEVQMSSIDIPVDQIKKIPALLGEKDVLKVIQLMPGVQKGSEGSSGIYVRGGGPDQNLIILDEAPVYNATHLFGFFSVFNGDALKSVELIKGGFPARYGGRLSSVIDLQMKDGNKEQIKGEAGIGIIATRLTLEGPLKKNKCSFLVSGRRTYIDALIQPFIKGNSKGGYFFYDLNAKLNYELSDKDRLFLSGYFGKDKFYIRDKSGNYDSRASLEWGNATGTLRWNHLFGQRLFSNLSLIFTHYQLAIKQSEKEKVGPDYYNMTYSSRIRDLGFKYHFDFMPHPDHYIRFGINSVWHYFVPQAFVIKSSHPVDNNSIVSKPINTAESGIFIEDDWKINPKLRANAGIRLSHFYSYGNSYVNPEPRISLRYMLTGDLSAKLSYASMNQYLHLLSNTGIGLPTDLWVPATSRIKPQRSHQVAGGFAKDFSDKGVTVTLEGYYKWMQNVLSYREGASFFNISENKDAEGKTWQDNVVTGKGWSYGSEVFIQKKSGKFTGWIGYTLSWTWLQFDSLNFGKKYFARYDRRHDISVVGIYEINKRITLSGTWVYGSGNAITLPIATYYVTQHLTSSQSIYGNNVVYDYGGKNSFRMAAYHRFDLGVQFHKQFRHCERILEISVYNLYNRQNPFYYYIDYDIAQQKNVLKQISIFPIIPSISWTLKF
jgi:hypothetical protein